MLRSVHLDENGTRAPYNNTNYVSSFISSHILRNFEQRKNNGFKGKVGVLFFRNFQDSIKGGKVGKKGGFYNRVSVVNYRSSVDGASVSVYFLESSRFIREMSPERNKARFKLDCNKNEVVTARYGRYKHS